MCFSRLDNPRRCSITFDFFFTVALILDLFSDSWTTAGSWQEVYITSHLGWEVYATPSRFPCLISPKESLLQPVRSGDWEVHGVKYIRTMTAVIVLLGGAVERKYGQMRFHVGAKLLNPGRGTSSPPESVGRKSPFIFPVQRSRKRLIAILQYNTLQSQFPVIRRKSIFLVMKPKRIAFSSSSGSCIMYERQSIIDLTLMDSS